MGVLIVAGTVTLVVLLVQRAAGRGPASLPAMTLDLPHGARMVSVAGAGERFAALGVTDDAAEGRRGGRGGEQEQEGGEHGAARGAPRILPDVAGARCIRGSDDGAGDDGVAHEPQPARHHGQ